MEFRRTLFALCNFEYQTGDVLMVLVLWEQVDFAFRGRLRMGIAETDLAYSLLGLPPCLHEEHSDVGGRAMLVPPTPQGLNVRTSFTRLYANLWLYRIYTWLMSWAKNRWNFLKPNPHWKIEQVNIAYRSSVLLRRFVTVFYARFITPNGGVSLLVEFDNGRRFKEIAAYVKLLVKHRQTRKTFYVEQWIPEERLMENPEDLRLFVNGKEVEHEYFIVEEGDYILILTLKPSGH